MQPQQPDPSILPIPFETDVYGTRSVNASNFPQQPDLFKKALESFIQDSSIHPKGIYLHFTLSQSLLLPLAHSLGFDIHHAQGEHITMKLWLDNGVGCRLPEYATHCVAAGGLCVDFERKRVLVIREKISADTVTWKIPGGHADVGEYIPDTAIREVWEETGIRSVFKGVVGMREKLNHNFGRNDIYFVCLLEPLTFEIVKDDYEIGECKWMDVEEWAKSDFKVEAQQAIAKIALDLVQNRETASKNLMLPREVQKKIGANAGTFLMHMNQSYVDQSSVWKSKLDFDKLKNH